jgi:hypothetical protein
MDIVFDGELEFLAFHDPESGEVQLLTVGVGGGGFGVELGEDAHLGVDEDDAFAQLALRGAMAPTPLLGPGGDAAGTDDSLDDPAGPPEAYLAEAEWPVDRPVAWRVDGTTLTVVLEGARRTQWARIGRTSLYVALDLEAEREAYVAALVFRALVSDPGFVRFHAALLRLGEA